MLKIGFFARLSMRIAQKMIHALYHRLKDRTLLQSLTHGDCILVEELSRVSGILDSLALPGEFEIQ